METSVILIIVFIFLIIGGFVGFVIYNNSLVNDEDSDEEDNEDYEDDDEDEDYKKPLRTPKPKTSASVATVLPATASECINTDNCVKKFINKNNTCSAFMQEDGNLVIYDTNLKPVWSSNSKIGTAPFRLAMQKDGNLVIYDSINNPVWASETGVETPKGPYRFVLQDDCKFVIYDKDSIPVWDSSLSLSAPLSTDTKINIGSLGMTGLLSTVNTVMPSLSIQNVAPVLEMPAIKI